MQGAVTGGICASTASSTVLVSARCLRSYSHCCSLTATPDLKGNGSPLYISTAVGRAWLIGAADRESEPLAVCA